MEPTNTFSIDFLTAELSLLNYWKSTGIQYLYKYKHRVKAYFGENRNSLELFYDLTNGCMFTDIQDIANFNDVGADDVKIYIIDLIQIRKNFIDAITNNDQFNWNEVNTLRGLVFQALDNEPGTLTKKDLTHALEKLDRQRIRLQVEHIQY